MAKLWAKLRGGPQIAVQVDDALLGQLGAHKWYITKQNYAYRVAMVDGARVHVALHHDVFGQAPDADHVIDHKDRDRLNCRRQNLRMIRRGPSQWNTGIRRTNTSGFKGVRVDRSVKGTTRYRAEIRANKRRFTLGSYPTPELAAVAYDAGARVLHGEYAVLNFPKGLAVVPRGAEARGEPVVEFADGE